MSAPCPSTEARAAPRFRRLVRFAAGAAVAVLLGLVVRRGCASPDALQLVRDRLRPRSTPNWMRALGLRAPPEWPACGEVLWSGWMRVDGAPRVVAVTEEPLPGVRDAGGCFARAAPEAGPEEQRLGLFSTTVTWFDERARPMAASRVPGLAPHLHVIYKAVGPISVRSFDLLRFHVGSVVGGSDFRSIVTAPTEAGLAPVRFEDSWGRDLAWRLIHSPGGPDDATAALEGLRSEDWLRRCLTLNELASDGRPSLGAHEAAVRERLKEMLHSREPWIGEKAFLALRRMPGALSTLDIAFFVTTPDADLRRAAAMEVCERREWGSPDVLEALARDPDPGVRYAALRSLALVPRAGCERIVLEGFADADPRVVEQAVHAARARRASAAVPHLVALAEFTSPGSFPARRAAAEALAVVSPEDAADLLMAAFRANAEAASPPSVSEEPSGPHVERGEMLHVISRCLRKTGDPRARDFFREYFPLATPRGTYPAAAQLAQLGDMDFLREKLRLGTWPERQAASVSLAAAKDWTSLPEVLNAWNRGRSEQRFSESLRRALDGREAGLALAEAAEAWSPEQRENALGLLEAIHNRRFGRDMRAWRAYLETLSAPTEPGSR